MHFRPPGDQNCTHARATSADRLFVCALSIDWRAKVHKRGYSEQLVEIDAQVEGSSDNSGK